MADTTSTPPPLKKTQDAPPTAMQPAPPEKVAAFSLRGFFGDAWHRLKKNRMAVACLWLCVVVFGLCCLYAVPHVAFEDSMREHRDALPVFFQPYWAQHEGHEMEAPSAEHWFGTDDAGRDIFARTLFGGFISFLVGICATTMASLIGILYGAVAGYFGGWIDNVLMRVVDVLYCLPFLLVLILIKVIADEIRAQLDLSVWWGFALMFIILGAYTWLTMARIARGQVLSVRNMDYVAAARAVGAGNGRVIALHVLPNILGPVIVYATMAVPQTILLESFLSFLGLGISEPHCSWGLLAKEGYRIIGPDMSVGWWLLVFPAATMVVSLFALNFLGDGIRDAFDPRMR